MQEKRPPRRIVRTDNFDLSLDDSEVLCEDVLEQLSKNPEVQLRLSDPLIQKILTRLDTSRDRRYTFSKLYETSEIFQDFIEVVATAVDFKHE
jgi:hypothetical protein